MNYLENQTLKLRALEPEDIDILYTWENNMTIWKLSNTLAPFSRYVLKRYLKNAHLDIFELKELRLVIELKNKTQKNRPIGLIDIFDYDPFHQRAGVGIFIHKTTDRSKAFGKQALQLLINYTFKYLNLHQLYCNISKSNDISLKLFSNEGFKIIGLKNQWNKNGSHWEDEYMLQLINKNT